MEATELRIGNFVLVDNAKSHPNLLNEPVIVVGINKKYEKDFQNSNATISFEIDKYNGGSQFNEFIKPIELTEEWILKLGFLKYDFMNGFFIKCNNKHLMIQFYNLDILIFYTKVCSDSKGHKMNGRDYFLGKKQINNVHQLQNLYFALTGKELTIKQ